MTSKNFDPSQGPSRRGVPAARVLAIISGIATLLLGSVDLPGADLSREAPQPEASLDEKDREFLTEALAQVHFGVNLARLAGERTQHAEVRDLAQGAQRELEETQGKIDRIAAKHGVGLEAHPTQSGATITGAGATDNIGQPRGPNSPGTPTEDIPREAEARNTSTPRDALQATAPIGDTREAATADKSFGVDVRVRHRQEMRLRKLSSLTGAEFDRAFLENLSEVQRDLTALFEEQASAGRDGELKEIAAGELDQLRRRHGQTRTLREKIPD